MINIFLDYISTISFKHNEIKPIAPSFYFSIFDIEFEIRWYTIFILIGVIVALLFCLNWIRYLKIKEEYIYWGLALGLIFGFLGARLYFCLFNWSYYQDDPLEIITNISDGGLAIHGGLIATAIFIIIYCKIFKLNSIKIFEIVAPGFLIAQAFGRWGNFFNQEAHGGLVPGYPNLDAQRSWLKTFLPDFIVNQMYIDVYNPGISDIRGYYHPTFLYESIWNIIGFIIILFLRKYYKRYYVGDGLFFYLIWYGIGRFIIEFMRTDSLMLGELKVAQIISLIMILLGTIGYILIRKIKINSTLWSEYK